MQNVINWIITRCSMIVRINNVDELAYIGKANGYVSTQT